MVQRRRIPYSSSIENPVMESVMKSCSGMRGPRAAILLASLVLALALASTAVLVKPELIGGSAHATSAAIGKIPVIGHP